VLAARTIRDSPVSGVAVIPVISRPFLIVCREGTLTLS
jgi:hypothetical protein